MSKFNSEMLRLACDLRDITQTQLAELCEINQSHISRIMHGEKEPAGSVLEKFSETLRFPISFFFQDGNYSGLGVSVVYFRKRAGSLVKHLRRVQAEVTVRRLQIQRLLRELEIVPGARTFRFMDIDDYHGKADHVAGLLRASWSLPLGPIPNLIGTIESAGGIVFVFPFGTTDIDAIAQWPDDLGRPLFFVNKEAPADRARFSLAHELGHMTMHRSATAEMEGEADRFAAEFLMPAREIAPQLSGLTLDKAAALKSYWRVSMAAIIRRAKDLGRITPNEYLRLVKRMSALGYSKQEPVRIEGESPRLVTSILDSYQMTNGYSISDLARLNAVFEDDFRSRYISADTGLRLAT